MNMFRDLSPTEVAEFKEWARGNYQIGGEIKRIWHPVIQEECQIMEAEAEKARMDAEAKKQADRACIGEVVSIVADINAELAGRIVVRVSFAGSLPKKKKLTKEEKALVMNVTEEVKNGLIGGDKQLWTSKEYDELATFIQKRRNEFASFGIPHVKFQAAHVVDITRIPEIEELAEKTETDLAEFVAKLIAVYPDQITPEATKLGPLHNPRDYPPVESLKGMFKFDFDWLSFGVPDELKQFDKRIYEKAKKKAEETWREVQANGVLLLRETISELVAGLVDTLTPKDGGEKKKFYASSVTKITDFLDTFSRRNICNDSELDAEVEKMRKLVSGIDLKAMSSDTRLRESVKADMAKVKDNLSSMVVSAKSRVYRFE
jgi:hypothetical protein